jgi:hypothetical protein
VKKQMPKRKAESDLEPFEAYADLIYHYARQNEYRAFQENIEVLERLAKKQDTAITKLIALQPPFRRTEAIYILNRIEEKQMGRLERCHHFHRLINFANDHPKDPYLPLTKCKDFRPLTEEENYEFEADEDPKDEVETLKYLCKIYWNGIPKTKLPTNQAEFLKFLDEDRAFLNRLAADGKGIEELNDTKMPDWGNWVLDNEGGEPARKKAK